MPVSLTSSGSSRPHPLHKSLNCGVEIEDQAPRMPVADHALQPEERSDPHAPRHGGNRVQAGSRIEHQVPCRQFHLVRAVVVFDDQFAAVVFVRIG
jgi:hypothetical protein